MRRQRAYLQLAVRTSVVPKSVVPSTPASPLSYPLSKDSFPSVTSSISPSSDSGSSSSSSLSSGEAGGPRRKAESASETRFALMRIGGRKETLGLLAARVVGPRCCTLGITELVGGGTWMYVPADDEVAVSSIPWDTLRSNCAGAGWAGDEGWLRAGKRSQGRWCTMTRTDVRLRLTTVLRVSPTDLRALSTESASTIPVSEGAMSMVRTAAACQWYHYSQRAENKCQSSARVRDNDRNVPRRATSRCRVPMLLRGQLRPGMTYNEGARGRRCVGAEWTGYGGERSRRRGQEGRRGELRCCGKPSGRLGTGRRSTAVPTGVLDVLLRLPGDPPGPQHIRNSSYIT